VSFKWFADRSGGFARSWHRRRRRRRRRRRHRHFWVWATDSAPAFRDAHTHRRTHVCIIWWLNVAPLARCPAGWTLSDLVASALGLRAIRIERNTRRRFQGEVLCDHHGRRRRGGCREWSHTYRTCSFYTMKVALGGGVGCLLVIQSERAIQRQVFPP
jgi:hypothetical protein